MKILSFVALVGLFAFSSTKTCDPQKETQCHGAVGTVCCPTPNAKCCSDGFHCCAQGQECSPSSAGYCKKSNGDSAFFYYPLIKGIPMNLKQIEDDSEEIGY